MWEENPPTQKVEESKPEGKPEEKPEEKSAEKPGEKTEEKPAPAFITPESQTEKQKRE